MRKRMLSAVLAASLLCAGGVACAQDAPAQSTHASATSRRDALAAGALSETRIKHHIASAGYKEVKGLKFDDGVWKAKARGGNDHWVRIRVGPTTGKVYQADAPSKLNKNEIKAKLTAQGYQNVHDVEFDDGLWKADAKSPQGEKVDLLVDPGNGSVVASQPD